MRRAVGGATLAVTVLLVAVMGPVMAGGALPGWVVAVWPGLAALPVGIAALALVVLGAAVVTAGVWANGRRRRV